MNLMLKDCWSIWENSRQWCIFLPILMKIKYPLFIYIYILLITGFPKNYDDPI